MLVMTSPLRSTLAAGALAVTSLTVMTSGTVMPSSRSAAAAASSCEVVMSWAFCCVDLLAGLALGELLLLGDHRVAAREPALQLVEQVDVRARPAVDAARS